MALNIKDVRAEMPNYQTYKDWQRGGDIRGIAIHHSATADRVSGTPAGNAHSFFDYHVNTRGWAHGGYNYVITGDGVIEYALDDKISAYHAGFKDPDNSLGLEYGQYWNNHYLAICLSGWFSNNRVYRDATGHTHPIPNNYVVPTEAQMASLLALIQHLRQKYDIAVENVRAHRELLGNSTACPGQNLDPAQLRVKLQALDEAESTPPPQPGPGTQPEVKLGEHVLILPDTDKYLTAAMTYIWKFEPDVTFAVDEARGRWAYVTALGDSEEISDSQLALLRSSGALLVQRIPGTPALVETTLDQLVQDELRFLLPPPETEPPGEEPEPEPPPEDTWRTYTIQPGDTLSLIARQMYGQSHLWRIIFEANRDTLADPGRIHPGQVIKIPPKPE